MQEWVSFAFLRCLSTSTLIPTESIKVQLIFKKYETRAYKCIFLPDPLFFRQGQEKSQAKKKRVGSPPLVESPSFIEEERIKRRLKKTGEEDEVIQSVLN